MDGNPSVRVTEESSLRLTPVFAAFRHIVDYCGTLPVDAYRLEGGARKQINLPPLLARQDEQGGPGLVTWLGQLAFGLATGNAVGWATDYDGFGYPADISWLHWSQWSYDELAKQWRVFGNVVPSSQIVHIPWIVPPGRKLALSPIEYQAGVIIAGLSAQEYADVKRGGGTPPSQLRNTMRDSLTDDVIQQARAKAMASFSTGAPFVTGKDWELTQVTIPPNQAQFVQTLKMSANQVAAAYGIDPTEVGGEAANNQEYTTEELRELRRAADMKPYLTRMERGLSRLMPMRQYVKLNVDSNMRADIKTRTDVVGAQILDGRMSVNEARELEDRPPVPGGDFHNVPAPTADPTNRGETP
jgi:phage portal protein BeeE